MNPALHTFAAEAMATAFHIDLAHADAEQARQAAQAAFAELADIEGRLTRHREDSDFARIGRLDTGGETVVSPCTFLCLQEGLRLYELTLGTFNLAYASGQPLPACIELRPDGHTVRASLPRPKLDPGGIGKGLALDLMGRLLEQDWDLHAVRLRASASTILALDPPPDTAGWEVAVGAGAARRQFPLRRAAISGSSVAVKGAHILDPRTGRPAAARFRAWSVAATGAEADALSTAFMILNPEEIRRVVAGARGRRAFLQDKPGGAAIEILPDAAPSAG